MMKFNEENLDLKTIYTTSLQATKDIKLQNFNYKFLMHTIPTNICLFKCYIGIQFYVIFAPWKLKHVITDFGKAFTYNFFWSN